MDNNFSDSDNIVWLSNTNLPSRNCIDFKAVGSHSNPTYNEIYKQIYS